MARDGWERRAIRTLAVLLIVVGVVAGVIGGGMVATATLTGPVDAAQSAQTGLTFGNQTTNGTTVTVESATLPNGGFVAVSTGAPNATNSMALGVSEYLPPGTHRNVTVDLRAGVRGSDANSTRLGRGGGGVLTLTAAAYADTDGDQQYDYLSSNRSTDQPYLAAAGGAIEPVTDSASVTVTSTEPSSRPANRTPGSTQSAPDRTSTEGSATTTDTNTNTTTTDAGRSTSPETTTATVESPAGTSTPASEGRPQRARVVFLNQTTDGAVVVVTQPQLPEGGFIAIYNTSTGQPTPKNLIGVSEYIGSNRSYSRVAIRLFDVPGRSFAREELRESTTLIAQAMRDTNDNQRFDYLTSNRERDGGYRRGSNPVANAAVVAIRQTTTTGEPAAQYNINLTNGTSPEPGQTDGEVNSSSALTGEDVAALLQDQTFNAFAAVAVVLAGGIIYLRRQ